MYTAHEVARYDDCKENMNNIVRILNLGKENLKNMKNKK